MELTSNMAAVPDSRTTRTDNRQTFSDVIEEYLAHCRRRVRSGDMDETTVRNYACKLRIYGEASLPMGGRRTPHMRGKFFSYPLGGMLVGDVGAPELLEFRGQLLDAGLRPPTADQTLRYVRTVLGYAVDRGYIAQVPGRNRMGAGRASKLPPVKPPAKAVVALLVRSAHCLKQRDQLMIKFAALTGLRSSEQRALQWRHIDIDQRTVEVEQRINDLGQIGPPKTDAGYRTVPISYELAADLAAWKAAAKWARPSDFVFATANATAMDHGNVALCVLGRAWKELLKPLPSGEAPRRFTWHGFRHFAISCWIESGVPLLKIQEWAGHCSPMMTLKIYGHLFKSSDFDHTMDKVAGDVLAA